MPLCQTVFRAATIAVTIVLLCSGSAAAQNSDLQRATALNEQVIQLYRQGHYVDAISIAREVLQIREKALGPDHPEVAESLTNLAVLYHRWGRYAEAEPLYKRSLAIKEKALRPDNAAVAISLDNLGALYDTEGRFAQAEPLLKRGLEIRERFLRPDDPDLAPSLNNLASFYYSQGRYAEAEPLYKRSLAIWESALGAEHPNVAVSVDNLAKLYRTQGRYAEAEPLLKRSLAIREKMLGLHHPDVAASLNDLAMPYQLQRRYAQAEPLYKRSLDIREAALGPDHPDVAEALTNLAVLYDNQGRYPEAEQLCKHSLAILEKTLGPDHPTVAASLNNLAALYQSQDRYAEAEPLFKRSLLIDETALGSDHPDVATGLNNLALLFLYQSRYAEAEPLFQRSLAILEKAYGPDHPLVAAGLNHFAALYAAQGRYDEGLSLSRRAVTILSRRFGEDTSTYTVGDAERRSERDYFLRDIALLHIAREPTAAAESFRVSQLARTSSAALAVAAMAARFASGNDALAALVREQQDLVKQWQGFDAGIIKAVSKPPAERDEATEVDLRRRLVEARTKLDALDARIEREFPAYTELNNPKPLEIGEALALLGPTEAMLVYLVGPKETWLWVLRRNHAVLHQLEIDADQLSIEVKALRERLDPALNPTLAPFPAARAYALYQKILAPAAPLLDGAHHILIVPDGALESLPFGVLVSRPPTTDPKSPADHRDIAWFTRDYATTVLPSVSTLRALRSVTSVSGAPLPFVGIGNPVLAGKLEADRGFKLASLFRGAFANVDAVRALPPLPETAEELRAVANALGAGDKDLYLGARASEPLLRQAALDRYRIVEFATHGLVSGDVQGLAEPALVLTPPQVATADNDGLLTASKVATLKLHADWVVLSACNTAASDGTPDAGGLSGLARAFFYAGARSVLVSHWSVPSKATVKLVTGTFNALKKDPSISRAEALRRAEMAMLNPENPAEYAHPLEWAPFVLVGEGGPGH
jgi:CHAT domain-containing protein/tetratricopeptide (TPR) repeat protein